MFETYDSGWSWGPRPASREYKRQVRFLLLMDYVCQMSRDARKIFIGVVRRAMRAR